MIGKSLRASAYCIFINRAPSKIRFEALLSLDMPQATQFGYCV
jgi:hypothetical protein